MMMADSAHFAPEAVASLDDADPPRHSIVVRISHWIITLAFFALVVSGLAILIAHPRFYWGKTGTVGAPSLFDLPIPFKIGHSGKGRALHFLSAWVCVLTGIPYVILGFFTSHFQKDLKPARSDLRWGPISRAILNNLQLKRSSDEQSRSYNVLQRLAYLAVIFILFPLVILTGLAMSPAIASVLPALVQVCGGFQSARTIHFFVSDALVIFFVLHIGMVSLAGPAHRIREMITGYSTARRRRS